MKDNPSFEEEIVLACICVVLPQFMRKCMGKDKCRSLITFVARRVVFIACENQAYRSF